MDSKKYQKVCVVCNEDYSTNIPQQKTCSVKCREEWRAGYLGSKNFANLAPCTTGAVSEMVVAADLLNSGYSVFRALSPSCFCDLIAHKDNKTYNIEVKTGHRTQTGKLAFPTLQNTGHDIIAIYVRQLDEISYLDKDKKEIKDFTHNHVWGDKDVYVCEVCKRVQRDYEQEAKI